MPRLGPTVAFVAIAAAALLLSGCGGFAARRMAQAPNSYPQWLAPKARVTLGFSSNLLTNFPAHKIASPDGEARLLYRVIPAADYRLRITSTNWTEGGRAHSKFTFGADVPAGTNRWSASPRGTVLLLHGYGVSQFAMAPWALFLAQEGWQCVLTDLRGHGKSTGRRIYFGLRETADLSAILDDLVKNGQAPAPIHAMGQSLGASLALKWKLSEPRLDQVIAITPYAGLSNAVLNIGHDYARWVPKWFLKSGLKKLPSLLHAEPGNFDLSSVLEKTPEPALFVAASDDRITPPEDVEKLWKICDSGSQYILEPNATHENVTYFLDDLAPAVRSWLLHEPRARSAAQGVLPAR